MSEMILPLAALSRKDTSTIGTKAAALGELFNAQFPVPNGFVLTNAAYAEFTSPLHQRILARITENVVMDPAELEAAATEIREWLQAQPFSARMNQEVVAALADLSPSGSNSFAARTSLPADELATAFGSGVARAYLGLVGADEIARAAAKCWAALWNSRAMYYRHRKKIKQTEVPLAVLVQPMVRAESAGVLFTQNPRTGARDELQITAIRGLGAPLTNARLRPNEFLMDKASGQVQDESIEEQIVKLVVGADGHTEEQGILPELAEAPALNREQLKALAELGMRVEQFFGEPQDVEWAIADAKVYVLQARPIGIRNA